MKKRRVKWVLAGMILLVVAVMAALIFKAHLDQDKDRKAQRERYEQMISEDGKTLLTRETLNEDFEIYVKNVNRGRSLFKSMIILFVVAFILIVILILYSGIVAALEERRLKRLVGPLLASVVFIGLFGAAGWIVEKKILPEMDEVDPETEGHFYVLEELEAAKMEEKTVWENGSDNSRTEVRYYLIKTSGGRIPTDQVTYELFDEPGKYYVGRTADTAFSLYSTLYFDLDPNYDFKK